MHLQLAILWSSLRFSRSASAAVCQPLHLHLWGEGRGWWAPGFLPAHPHWHAGTNACAAEREGCDAGCWGAWHWEQTWMIITTAKYYSFDQTCVFDTFDHKIQVNTDGFHTMSSSASKIWETPLIASDKTWARWKLNFFPKGELLGTPATFRPGSIMRFWRGLEVGQAPTFRLGWVRQVLGQDWHAKGETGLGTCAGCGEREVY